LQAGSNAIDDLLTVTLPQSERGAGTFSSAIQRNSGPTFTLSAGLTDFNGDGKLDVISGNYSSNNLFLSLGNGDGSFGGRNTINIVDGSRLISGDLNGDGYDDLVASGGNANRIDVLLGGVSGFTSATYTSGSTSAGVNLADFNGDGITDIANLTHFDSRLNIFLGHGDGTFNPRISTFVGGSPMGVAVGDVNRDGRIDIATVEASSQQVDIRFGNGDGTFNGSVTFAVGPISVDAGIQMADADLDGDMDIFAGTGSGVITIYSNGDGTFTAPQTLTTSFTSKVSLGDLNNDGLIDIVAANSTSGGVASFLNQTTIGAAFPEVDFGTSSKALITGEEVRILAENLISVPAQTGAETSRVKVALSALLTRKESYKAAFSRIEDVDIASETAASVRLNILQQTGASILGQANSAPQIALTLLQGI
jgi:flagellin-like hook-associated protein FlgL